jgi:hypothetical protein
VLAASAAGAGADPASGMARGRAAAHGGGGLIGVAEFELRLSVLTRVSGFGVLGRVEVTLLPATRNPNPLETRYPIPTTRMNAYKAISIVLFAGAAACHRTTQVGSPPPSAPAPAPPRPAVLDLSAGERILSSMHAMYDGKWYRTMTFVQKTTITTGASTFVNTWYEAAQLPGKLRIDVGEPSRGDGTLYRGDSVYNFTAGKVSSSRADQNDLLILGFDVYTQPVAITAKVLRARGFDLRKSHETTWQGKPVFVVGALAGDTVSKQFWVEKERLLFVRLLDGVTRNDIRFNQYVRANGGWMAVEVVQLVAGKPRLKEEYSEVRTNITLDPALFVPATWKSARHWRSTPDR